MRVSGHGGMEKGRDESLRSRRDGKGDESLSDIQSPKWCTFYLYDRSRRRWPGWEKAPECPQDLMDLQGEGV